MLVLALATFLAGQVFAQSDVQTASLVVAGTVTAAGAAESSPSETLLMATEVPSDPVSVSMASLPTAGRVSRTTSATYGATTTAVSIAESAPASAGSATSGSRLGRTVSAGAVVAGVLAFTVLLD